MPNVLSNFSWNEWLANFSWNECLATRAAVVRRIAKRFPPGTRLQIHDRSMYVISYFEDGGLCVTATDPAVDYERAVTEREPVCKCCKDKLESLRV